MRAVTVRRLTRELLAETTSLGEDYYRICDIHRWASLESVEPDLAATCPFCAVELTSGMGALRYRTLMIRLREGL